MGILLKVLKWGGFSSLILFAILITINYWMVSRALSISSNKLSEIEARDVALVLGTSQSINGRFENPFFTHRIQAAAQLYHAGKVKHILVSGDNSNNNYNEPRDMRKALMKLAVPSEAITMDFAGLRTLDSVVRCKEIFQQKKIIIISQAYHNYRALFIAHYHGIDAVAYNAKFPSNATFKVNLREFLARPKALLDLYVFKTRPKFLGEKVDIRV